MDHPAAAQPRILGVLQGVHHLQRRHHRRLASRRPHDDRPPALSCRRGQGQPRHPPTVPSARHHRDRRLRRRRLPRPATQVGPRHRGLQGPPHPLRRQGIPAAVGDLRELLPASRHAIPPARRRQHLLGLRSPPDPEVRPGAPRPRAGRQPGPHRRLRPAHAGQIAVNLARGGGHQLRGRPRRGPRAELYPPQRRARIGDAQLQAPRKLPGHRRTSRRIHTQPFHGVRPRDLRDVPQVQGPIPAGELQAQDQGLDRAAPIDQLSGAPRLQAHCSATRSLRSTSTTSTCPRAPTTFSTSSHPTTRC